MSLRFHRFIAVATGVAIAAQSFPIAFAFSDVSGSTGYRAAIEALQTKGVIEGYADGTFKPLDGINRAEFLKILLQSRGEVPDGKGNCFPDVSSEWFARYVCAAKEEGIVSGYPDGTFRPQNPINFVEASKMLSLAYGQHTESEGGEWYEGYGLALESSSAIPPTIGSLDAGLKRGEMAEMMWRLSEERTDQPSKGLLNVKYPDMKVNLASNEPQRAKSCTDLRAFTESAQQTYGGVMYYNRGMMEDAVALPMATGKSMESREQSSGSDFSKTNVQVEGVDEGDRVKTDGSFLYIVSRRDSTVRIVDVRDPKKMKVVSTTAFTDFIPQDLYISGTRLAVTGQVTQKDAPMPMMEDSMNSKMMIYPPIWFVQKAGVRIFDVADKAYPKETRSLAFEGNTISTRLVGDRMLLVMSSGTRWYGAYREKKDPIAAALVPVYDDSALNIKDKPVSDCDDVTILPRVPRPEYLVVASIPLQSSAEVGRTVILGNGQNVYASLKNLYVAAPDWSYAWRGKDGGTQEKTTVYRFAYEGNGTVFKAHGSVPGHLLNQFSMDEQGDTFRIATTISPSWSPDTLEGVSTKSTNNLFVLESENMETVGSVRDIAPGESIYSVRFMGDRAYMVTFKQVDPLFVIDLSSPRNPKILGKLKIPGYSNYLHPVDETHILGFGKEVDESIDKDKVHSDDAVYYTAVLGMKIALFDVSDVAHPKEIYKEVIGDRGTDSPLLYDHKALLFDRERGLLSFPVTVHEKSSAPKQNEWAPDTTPVFQGAYVYSFDLQKGFSLKGKISHHTSDEFQKAGDYWYDQNGLDIDRILRVGDDLFTVSEAQLKANNLSSLTEEGTVPLATEAGGNGYPIPMPMAL